jgi:hypothetical protein
MQLELLFIIATVLTPLGAVLNALNIKVSFILWSVANIILLVQTSFLGVWNLQVLYLFLLLTSILGWVNRNGAVTVKFNSFKQYLKTRFPIKHRLSI